jgi:phenylacetate-coenzyme A ligase PaaK-like adenylate-forming protein
MSVLYISKEDGTYEKVPVTPENTRRYIESIPLYRDDDDPVFWPKEKIYEMQNQLFKRQMEWVWDGHDFYKRKFRELGIEPGDIQSLEDLEKLPLTHKKDYMAEPEAFRLKPSTTTLYDWIFEVTYTTGSTTGMPTPFWNTIHDAHGIWMMIFRGIKLGGFPPYSRVINLFPLGPVPHIGFFRARDIGTLGIGSLNAYGCTGITYPEFPVHRSIDYAIDVIEKTGAEVWLGIASFMRRLIMRAEEQGRDFSATKHIQALGEAAPRAMREDMKRRLQNMGAEDPFISNSYGFTEMQGAMPECTDFSGCHNPAPNLYFFEVVDEKTGKRLPDGERGLICITHLNRRGTVLLRYVIGDLGALTHETCPYCGRNGERVVIAVGSTYATRTSELVNLKGTLINPEILRDEVANTPGVKEYQIVFTKKDPNDPYSPDDLIVKVALMEGFEKDKVEKDIQNKVLTAVEMRCKVEFVPMEEIYDPTVALKAYRVIDMRPKVE